MNLGSVARINNQEIGLESYFGGFPGISEQSGARALAHFSRADGRLIVGRRCHNFFHHSALVEKGLRGSDSAPRGNSYPTAAGSIDSPGDRAAVVGGSLALAAQRGKIVLPPRSVVMGGGGR